MYFIYNYKQKKRTMDPRQHHRNVKYLFAYYNNSEKCWSIPNRRFILIENKNRNTLSGQFIQSMWYMKQYTCDDKIEFAVLGVDVNISAIDVEKDMNKLKNPFPTYHDIPYYVKNSAYYIMDPSIMGMFLKLFEKETDTTFTLKSFTNRYQTLTLRIFKDLENKFSESIFISGPSFETCLDKIGY